MPADQLTPEAIMKRLADYIDFAPVKSPDANSAAGNNAAPSAGNVSDQPTGPSTAQLKRGMKIAEVTALLGRGKQLSESVGDGGLKTQVYEYVTSDRVFRSTRNRSLLGLTISLSGGIPLN